MKTDVYVITITRKGIYHSQFWFVGKIPSQTEVDSAVNRRLDRCFTVGVQQDARLSRRILQNAGVPAEVGENKWIEIGIEIGSVRLEHKDAWSLEP